MTDMTDMTLFLYCLPYKIAYNEILRISYTYSVGTTIGQIRHIRHKRHQKRVTNSYQTAYIVLAAKIMRHRVFWSFFVTDRPCSPADRRPFPPYTGATSG